MPNEVQVSPPLGEDSHLITAPEFPLRVKVPEFEPKHTTWTEGEIEPPVAEGSIVNDPVNELPVQGPVAVTV